jgi:hypothetical protein
VLQQDKVATGDLTASEAATLDAVDNVKSDACFQAFRMHIAGAVKSSKGDKAKVLIDAFRACRPARSSAWTYDTMVLQYLVDVEWDPAPILGVLAISSVATPPTYSPENTTLLQTLDRILTAFPHCVSQVHRLCMKIAEEASTADQSSGSTQDALLLQALRQLWQTAHAQGNEDERAAIESICAVASKAKDPRHREVLRSILVDPTSAGHLIRNLVVRASENSTAYTVAERVLACVPLSRLRVWIPVLSRSFVRKLAHGPLLGRADTWLRILHHLDSACRSRESVVGLLDTAMPSLVHAAFSRGAPGILQSQILLKAILLRVSQQDEFHSISDDRMSTLLQSMNGLDLTHNNPVPFNELAGMLLSRMRNDGLPYRTLAEKTINALAQHAGLGSTLSFLNILDRQKVTVSDTQLLDGVIKERIIHANNEAFTRSATKRQHNAFTLQTCQRIVEVLSRISITNKAATLDLVTLQAQRQFQHILDRAHADHALPLKYRNMTADLLIQQRVFLIHQLAHQYSTDSTRSCRQASRSIYYLYKYLLYNSHPIGPLFTKAVVRTAIIRPLSQNHFVSARRLIWVCHLVARVEGEAAAKKIEYNFWLWRGDLIKHAKSVYIGVGGDRAEKAYIGTMKRLNLI